MKFYFRFYISYCVLYIQKGDTMPKRYRKPIIPTTKKTFVGIDKDNGKDVYVDTGLPWITTTQEYQRSYWTRLSKA